jgi:regulator of replication initiation timing
LRYIEAGCALPKKQETNFATRILFRNVPLNAPDEELINLALCYGQPVGGVKRERLFNQKDRGKFGANRSLDVLLNPGQAVENFFWLEGPLPSDQGRRITVTHQNQPQQCSNCFGYSTNKYGTQLGLCPGNGNGKACKELNTERAKMGPYMKDLERLLGYRSTKSKFSRVGVMNEPVIDEDETEITFNTIYKSPIIEKDEQIQALLSEQENLKLENEKLKKKLPTLQESLIKTTSKLSAVQKKVHQKSKQINQASFITEKRLAEAISLEPAYLILILFPSLLFSRRGMTLMWTLILK